MIQPVDGIIASLKNLISIFFWNLVLELVIVQWGFHVVTISLQTILGCNSGLLSFIFGFELFSISYHFLNFITIETTFFIGNGDFFSLSRRFVPSGDIQNTIGINIKCDFNLWNTSGSWWDSRKIKFTQKVVILGHSH